MSHRHADEASSVNTGAQKRIMLLIKIKFLGPTNYTGSRYKATVKDGDSFQYSATVPSTYASDNGDALTAAEAVARKVRIDFSTHAGIKDYDVEIVGSYDGDYYATMTPVYTENFIQAATAMGMELDADFEQLSKA